MLATEHYHGIAWDGAPIANCHFSAAAVSTRLTTDWAYHAKVCNYWSHATPLREGHALEPELSTPAISMAIAAFTTRKAAANFSLYDAAV
jgi:hypothetical protein